jgi:hypothetical protein
MARDRYHKAVRIALEKEGWVITHDPLVFSVGEVDMEVDLGAEAILGAERNNQKIAIEIKSFIDDSPVSAFHKARGQYENYLLGLQLFEPDRVLFLAVPKLIYDTFFQRPFIKLITSTKNFNFIVRKGTHFLNQKSEKVL